jgi:hypothetical protein
MAEPQANSTHKQPSVNMSDVHKMLQADGMMDTPSNINYIQARLMEQGVTVNNDTDNTRFGGGGWNEARSAPVEGLSNAIRGIGSVTGSAIAGVGAVDTGAELMDWTGRKADNLADRFRTPSMPESDSVGGYLKEMLYHPLKAKNEMLKALGTSVPSIAAAGIATGAAVLAGAGTAVVGVLGAAAAGLTESAMEQGLTIDEILETKKQQILERRPEITNKELSQELKGYLSKAYGSTFDVFARDAIVNTLIFRGVGAVPGRLLGSALKGTTKAAGGGLASKFLRKGALEFATDQLPRTSKTFRALKHAIPMSEELFQETLQSVSSQYTVARETGAPAGINWTAAIQEGIVAAPLGVGGHVLTYTADALSLNEAGFINGGGDEAMLNKIKGAGRVDGPSRPVLGENDSYVFNEDGTQKMEETFFNKDSVLEDLSAIEDEITSSEYSLGDRMFLKGRIKLRKMAARADIIEKFDAMPNGGGHTALSNMVNQIGETLGLLDAYGEGMNSEAKERLVESSIKAFVELIESEDPDGTGSTLTEAEALWVTSHAKKLIEETEKAGGVEVGTYTFKGDNLVNESKARLKVLFGNTKTTVSALRGKLKEYRERRSMALEALHKVFTNEVKGESVEAATERRDVVSAIVSAIIEKSKGIDEFRQNFNAVLDELVNEQDKARREGKPLPMSDQDLVTLQSWFDNVDEVFDALEQNDVLKMSSKIKAIKDKISNSNAGSIAKQKGAALLKAVAILLGSVSKKYANRKQQSDTDNVSQTDEGCV